MQQQRTRRCAAHKAQSYNQQPTPSLLLALPHELLQAVLANPAIRSNELAALQQTSTAMRRLVDDAAWRTIFVRDRHQAALAHNQPSCFKAELARREQWSKSWASLETASSSSNTACVDSIAAAAATADDDDGAAQRQATQHHGLSPTSVIRSVVSSAVPLKLRKYVLNIAFNNLSRQVSSPRPPPPPERRTVRRLVVDAAAAAAASTSAAAASSAAPHPVLVFATISEALEAAAPYDVVAVQPGVYLERLRIAKPVDLVGDGPLGSVVVVGVDGPTIDAFGQFVARVANLRIEQQSTGASCTMTAAVLIKGGATFALEESSVTSDAGHCIVIQGATTKAYIVHNRVHDGKGVGVLVCDGGSALIEDNEIARNGRAGIAVLSGGDPVVRANKIHAGFDSGVLVSEKGRGTIEGNDIFDNRRAGVAILREGAPVVRKNRIYNGCDSGVLVCENGRGSVVDNVIYANRMAGVAIGRGGASSITGNTIRDGRGGSLCLSQYSCGIISANVIMQDPSTSMQVPDDLFSTVVQQNQVQCVTGGATEDGAASQLCDRDSGVTAATDDDARPMDWDEIHCCG